AIRLLLFTGCRLREILHLKWEQVDLERGLLFLADSKTGRKTVILNAPALAVLAGLDRLGPYVLPGDDRWWAWPADHRQAVGAYTGVNDAAICTSRCRSSAPCIGGN